MIVDKKEEFALSPEVGSVEADRTATCQRFERR
jgi:hypothetical protein